MKIYLRFLNLAAGSLLLVPAVSSAQQPVAPASGIAAKTAGMEKRDGFVPVYLDSKEGKILLEIPRDSMRTLMLMTLATGLGSNPIGLDRGAGGPENVARFDRNGARVLVVFENWNYRTSLNNPAHARTITEAFPPSTVASLPLVAEEGGRMLVDATDFFLRDWLDVSATLAAQNEGSYSLARDRSSVYKAYTRAFPGNTEVDVSLTYVTSGRPGNTVSSIVPYGQAFTLRQHVSIIPLPDDNYKPRMMDPRVGYFGIRFKDYGQPIQNPLDQRWAARHRLERVNPADPNSNFKQPIVYYIDRGIPEPVRSATVEGARFWVEAFDRAGLRGAFRVEDLPEGVDPMDIRYNVVQWENRNERGWSIGGALGDPRTGELIKGMARMDSHRARTDYNLYAGLMGADAAAADTAFVLARIRQVTAHEIGHTLGLAHNYIASTYERGSLMDYPPPRVRLGPGGNIDISSAYDVGPGEYDVWAIRWGYGIFPGNEQDSLAAIVREGLGKGFLFLSDDDARPEYASDPRTNLWDDAATPLEFLQHQTAVRRVAMSRFGERNIRVGEPISLLQERFVPVYLMHRFAINSVSKTIGGVEYANAVRGDAVQATRPISAAQQRRALAALVAELRPSELAIPDTVVTLLGPRPFDYRPYVELFGSRTRPAFDELGAMRTLSQMIVDAVLQRERAARVVQSALHESNPLTLSEIVDALATPQWTAGAVRSVNLRNAIIDRIVQRSVADRMLTIASDKEASPEVRSLVEFKMRQLRDRARTLSLSGSIDDRAHWASITGDFTRWLERQELPTPSPALRAPPGDPFGADGQ
ncbi:MAG: zinc-dependent metalloprotease [Gemmatimonadaceae bacterium]|nr:zinc-dependent metalloprotease [Gemmatimonadaceae bacterium]